MKDLLHETAPFILMIAGILLVEIGVIWQLVRQGSP